MSIATEDPRKAEAFVGKALGDMAGTMSVLLATIGDRTGLFRALLDAGPLTAAEVADRAGTDARYTREWLSGMTAAGYLEYDPDRATFILPAEHAPVVAQEGGPVFFAGAWEEIAGALPHLDAVIKSVRHGGGVAPADYGATFWHGVERFSLGWFENHLLQEWIPAMPEVQAKLQAGCEVADVGCGTGRALVKLATAYPASRFTGYDAIPANVERAARTIKEAGLAERIRVGAGDAADGLDRAFDVIFTFDVVHDSTRPASLLGAIHAALRPGGRYVCLDINSSNRLQDNVGPLGAVFYGFSLLYCMTSSLGAGGAGLGTCGFNEQVADQMGREAGFSRFRRVPLENPFNILYEAAP